MMETPSSRILAAAVATTQVADAEGHVLQVRRMTALDRLRLYKAAGPELARNDAWMGMALVACSVAEIDQIPVPMPINEPQIEALVSRLGDAGIAAAMQVYQRDQPPDAGAFAADVGNSPGTPT